MMARGGNPKLTWLEDQVISLALHGVPVVRDHSQDLATVQSFLENKFPDLADSSIVDFINTVNRVRGEYVTMILMSAKGIDTSRNGTRKKYKKFYETLIDFQKAMIDCLGPSWELIRCVDCHGKPAEESPLRARYDSLDFERFHEQLLGLTGAVLQILNCLKGTAQDRSRAERLLVHQLWSKWMDLGFPEPRLVRGADDRDPDAADEDPFAETVRLVFDTLYSDPKLIRGEVTYTLRAVIEAGKKKLRAPK
jgi:hypothetical protein